MKLGGFAFAGKVSGSMEEEVSELVGLLDKDASFCAEAGDENGII